MIPILILTCAIALIWVMQIAIVILHARTRRRLTALRANCFITNERGHRVRYANASPERRDAAERGAM